ncbi:MAG TPA: ABC transporter permease [Thermoanaerobaculia bacterium]|nr:ABC transporter permease [Thermoanaerobaculia bacterium]
MSQLTQDLRFAVRNLRKQPALLLAAILTLALGIGVNAAIFSIVDSVLLQPPPFRDPGRVVIIWASNPDFARAIGIDDDLPSATAHIADWAKASSVESIASLQADRRILTEHGFPQLLGVVRVTGDFFKVLGADAEIGRTLGPADDPVGKGSTVVLSHHLWQDVFGGDPKVLGQKIILSGSPYTVVGVMGPRFNFPRGGHDAQAGYGFQAEPDLWMPMEFPAQARQDHQFRGNVAIARLKPGVSVATADSEIKAICKGLGQAFPESDKGWSAKLQPIMDKLIGDVKPMLGILTAAVGLVLLIACINVANLLLARAASRQKEIAVRMAMGAGRRRLISQLLTESGLLAVLGGLVGVFLAWAGLRLFAGFVPTGLLGTATMRLDARTLAFTAALCILTTLLAGLIPAFQMTRPDLAGTLREGTRAGAGTAGSGRTRNALVVLEVAVAVLVMIGAGLLLRSFVRLLDVDNGFRPQRILTAEFALPPSVIPVEKRGPFMESILERVKPLPGISSAALISDLPMGGGETVGLITIEGRPEPKPGEAPTVAMRTVSPGYFELMSVPLRKGRYFTPQDRQDSIPVVVINDVMAKEQFPNEDPLGKRIRLLGLSDTWYTVVGVVAGIRYSGPQGELRSELYRLVSQAPPGTMPFIMRIAMSTAADPDTMADKVRAAVKEVNPEQPVSTVVTMEQLVSKSIAKPRFSMLLLVLFAALALLLSVIGIYGITAYAVSQRTRELGLRMALGAQPQGILNMVLGETGRLALLGVFLGLAAAFGLTKVLASYLSSQLFGVEATDPLIFVAVAIGLVLISLAAAFLPGRRATRVDPLTALRAE